MKKYNCPECYMPLTDDFSCENGHKFFVKEGVLTLMNHTSWQRLTHFLEKFEAYREKNGFRIKDESIYPQLPFVENGLAGTSWKARAMDMKRILERLPQDKKLAILEIGGWNGWLSYRLTAAGHALTSVDFFTDKYDGLRAMQFYPKQWTCLQMDVTEVDKILASRFEVIILNWGAAYIPDLPLYVDKLKTLLHKNGLLIFTGIAIYLNPLEKARELAVFQRKFEAEYDIPLFFNPTKGYLTWADKKALAQKGFHFRLYPFWRSQLKAALLRKGALAFYAFAAGN